MDKYGVLRKYNNCVEYPLRLSVASMVADDTLKKLKLPEDTGPSGNYKSLDYLFHSFSRLRREETWKGRTKENAKTMTQRIEKEDRLANYSLNDSQSVTISIDSTTTVPLDPKDVEYVLHSVIHHR